MSQYEDIIRLPHPEPKKRRRMPVANRAAQFAPFEALVGHKDSIRESARRTEQRMILDENALDALNRRMQEIFRTIGEERPVFIRYFQPDERKDGGAYVTVTGIVKRVDALERKLYMTDGSVISMEEVCALEFADS